MHNPHYSLHFDNITQIKEKILYQILHEGSPTWAEWKKQNFRFTRSLKISSLDTWFGLSSDKAFLGFVRAERVS